MSKLDDIIQAPLTEDEVTSYALGNKEPIHDRMKVAIKDLMLSMLDEARTKMAPLTWLESEIKKL